MSHDDRNDDRRFDLEALASCLPDMVMASLEVLAMSEIGGRAAEREALSRFLADFKSEIAAAFDPDDEVLVALGLRKRGKHRTLSHGARLLRAATTRFARDLRHVLRVRRKLMAREKKAV